MTPAGAMALIRSPAGKKMMKYSATSLICVVISSSLLAVLVGILHWGAFPSALTACAVTTLPSYLLNRFWAWGKSGAGHLLKEVAPFWVMAFIGLAFSSWTSVVAQSYADRHHLSNVPHTAVVDAGFMGAFAVLWFGKFLIINKYLFASDPDESDRSQESERVSALAAARDGGTLETPAFDATVVAP